MAKFRQPLRNARIFPCSLDINPAVTRVQAIRPYHSHAQIQRNNFPQRASELLNNEIKGRRTWPIGSKEK
jgi:hypothetical protein